MADNELIKRIAEHFDRIACAKCGAAINVSALDFFTQINCPSCDTEQVVPAQLLNFLLVGHLGTGGMASVFEAYDRALSRRVAIKIMRLDFASDPALIDNFLREARSAAQINHSNVVQIYQVGQEKGLPFIVMELLKGGRLDAHTDAGKPMDELSVLQIGLDAAVGLQAADAIHLVHGDIKPANILFDKKGNAKITDFGLAKFQNKKSEDGKEIWGTPHYIAPEKVRRQPEDARSDIYSLGATLYHALTGHPPFKGKDTKEVVLARLQNLPTPMSERRPGLHPESILLIDRMLEPDPARRTPTYSSLISDLKRTILAVQNHTSSIAGPSLSPASGRPRWLLPAVGAGLVVVIGLVVALSGGGKKVPPGPTPAPAPTPPLVAPPKPEPPLVSMPAPLNESAAIRIDCGINKGPYTDKNGREWSLDLPYSPQTGRGFLPGGEHHPSETKIVVLNAEDPVLYQTYRWVLSPKRLKYQLDIKSPGAYVLRLHFMESRQQGPGKGIRLFNIWINGEKRIDKLDIYVEAGGGFKALVKELPVQVDAPVSLLLELEPVKENTQLCALELVPAVNL